MTELMTSSDIDALIAEIIHLDCQPSVFKLHIHAAPSSKVYTVCVEFELSKGSPPALSVESPSIQVALEKMLKLLRNNYGKCPVCGQYVKNCAAGTVE